MKKNVTYILLLLITTLVSCQNNKQINQDWLNEDLNFLNDITKIVNNNPSKIENLIPRADDVLEIILQNGYKLNTGSYGYGYITVYYKKVLYKDSLISYQLYITNKKVEFLNEHSSFKASSLFNTKHLDNHSYLYNLEGIIKDYDLSEKYTDEFNFYLTPYSGVYYGCSGGYANEILENREQFMYLTDHHSLSKEQIILMLESLNPAVRLTAIEYYKINIGRIKDSKIDSLIENVFSSWLKTPSLDYDIEVYVDSKNAVNYLVKHPCESDRINELE